MDEMGAASGARERAGMARGEVGVEPIGGGGADSPGDRGGLAAGGSGGACDRRGGGADTGGSGGSGSGAGIGVSGGRAGGASVATSRACARAGSCGGIPIPGFVGNR